MDAFEHVIDCLVVVAVGASAFDDAGVVSIDHNVQECRRDASNEVNEKFKADDIYPSDVLFDSLNLSVWKEMPGFPLVSNGDANVNIRVSI